MELNAQGLQFLLALGFGITQGIHYDILRTLRRAVPFLKHLTDLWFVLAYLIGNLLFALYVGNGEYRIFMFLASLSGLLLWMLICSRLFLRILYSVLRFITFPIRLLWRFFQKFVKKLRVFLKKLFSSEKKSVTIQSDQRLR